MNSSQKAINSACRMLGIREHSEKQIRTKLIKKGFEKEDIAKSVEFLCQNSWLSNERFCGAFIRSRVAKGQGKVRIEFELLQNEIAQTLIDESFEQEKVNWQFECERVLVKKILTFHSTNKICDDGLSDERFLDDEIKIANKKLDYKNKLKIERFMKYRGFEHDEVKKAFSKLNIKINYE